VVDDEEMVAAALRTFLELTTTYRVLAFTSPQAALGALRTEPVDVVISDFMMPEMDGIRFLEQVRSRSPHTSRILLTGYADVENAVRAINDAGVYHYLQKPWDNEHLKLVVRNGVERCALIRALDARMAALDDANAALLAARRRLIQMFL
jgi:response regulator RpfG family c-di-GMP phosphodiesterase